MRCLFSLAASILPIASPSYSWRLRVIMQSKPSLKIKIEISLDQDQAAGSFLYPEFQCTLLYVITTGSFALFLASCLCFGQQLIGAWCSLCTAEWPCHRVLPCQGFLHGHPWPRLAQLSGRIQCSLQGCDGNLRTPFFWPCWQQHGVVAVSKKHGYATTNLLQLTQMPIPWRPIRGHLISLQGLWESCWVRSRCKILPKNTGKECRWLFVEGVWYLTLMLCYKILVRSCCTINTYSGIYVSYVVYYFSSIFVKYDY